MAEAALPSSGKVNMMVLLLISVLLTVQSTSEDVHQIQHCSTVWVKRRVAIYMASDGRDQGMIEHIAKASEKEAASADNRGAKPKKTYLMHSRGRILKEKEKHPPERDKRIASKWKEKAFENIPAVDLTQSDSSEASFGKAVSDGFSDNSIARRKYPFANKYSREPMWNKETGKRQDTSRAKNTKHVKNASLPHPPKERSSEKRKETTLHERGPNFVSVTQTQLSCEAATQDGRKPLLQEGYTSRRWKKQNDTPKSKETHTGSLIEQLTSEKYECMVCCEVIRVVAPVWSCQNCYHVFHLSCIKKWARSPAAQTEDGNSGWRCPACQNVSSQVPNIYTCFCGVWVWIIRFGKYPIVCIWVTKSALDSKRMGLLEELISQFYKIIVNLNMIRNIYLTKITTMGWSLTLKPDILECEDKCALGSLSNNKASGGDHIPAELFKILKDDAVKVLRSICQQIWKNSGHRIGKEHMMRKAGLDESPIGITIAKRNIKNLRYADDTTLMAESEDELKSLLIRVKEESTKVVLTLHIKKTKIMASSRVKNPEWNRNEIPHSCGELCRKRRSAQDCPHLCNILCHPGPCPSCPAFMTKKCECGRTSHSVRCGHSNAIQCTNICGNVLNCGKHNCTQICHSGKCQPCELTVKQASFSSFFPPPHVSFCTECYCGSTSREILCGASEEHFSCLRICSKKLSCGMHSCAQVCHPQSCQLCPRLPEVVHCCPCGQTPLSKLLELGCTERKLCTDPIPSCGRTCGKSLPCSSNDAVHTCENLCHEGECGLCSRTSKIYCRCALKTKVICEKEKEHNIEKKILWTGGRHSRNVSVCPATWQEQQWATLTKQPSGSRLGTRKFHVPLLKIK
ncbi:Transcriptional repressor NF-X1, partial [Varanus komodoensis]